MLSSFSHVDTWIFDLDETLYPPETPLFPQIERRMTAWISDHLAVPEAEADRMRRGWWEVHGTSLAGLMADHGIRPEPFLSYVHDVDMAHLDPAPELRARLLDLPGRRIVHTNGTEDYAARVLARRGLSDAFDAVYGVETTEHRPKPEADAYDRVERADGYDPARAGDGRGRRAEPRRAACARHRHRARRTGRGRRAACALPCPGRGGVPPGHPVRWSLTPLPG